MAPELPPRLVCVDLTFQEDSLQAAVEYIEVRGNERLRVRWDVKSQPPGFFPVCDGVAYVKEADGVTKATPDKDVRPSSLGDSRYRWIQGLLPKERWMMLILVLPENFTIAKPLPSPTDAKDFGGRLALYWRLKADEFGSTETQWTLKKFDGNMQSEAGRLNSIIVKARKPPLDPNADIVVEDIKPPQTESKRMRILLALFASPVLVALIGLGYQRWQATPSPPPTQYSGRVIDVNTRQVISDAKVSIDTQPSQIYYTDSEGIFYLKLQQSIDTVHIRVEKPGYVILDRTVPLSRTGLEDIRLTSTPTSTPSPSSSPSPAPTQKPTKNNNTNQRIDGILNRRSSNKPN